MVQKSVIFLAHKMPQSYRFEAFASAEAELVSIFVSMISSDDLDSLSMKETKKYEIKVPKVGFGRIFPIL